MKKKLILAVLVLSILSCVFLSACGSKENAIVGKWKRTYTTGNYHIYEFSKDKTCKGTDFNALDEESSSRKYIWEYISEEKYYNMKYATDPDTNIWKITIENNTIKVVSYSSLVSATYTKI